MSSSAKADDPVIRTLRILDDDTVSTVRVGPFRTAPFMNLEPLLATVGSALFLGEVIMPLQALGVRR